ncbi:hypothetical protein PoB_001753900 [Plakobranchus ocellatus]|uniref:Uncharacterized protein n=1 Tax=Plakobranchus ocellatus TaxID=259542 RepID=A0AAV3Z6T0_9GAST|nr:hypothetical protein PoB_001753900 [Plakobranchus ocellatus]
MGELQNSLLCLLTFVCLMIACYFLATPDWFTPQQGDLRLSGPPSGQGAGGGAQTRDRKVPANLRADSLSTMPPMPLTFGRQKLELTSMY